MGHTLFPPQRYHRPGDEQTGEEAETQARLDQVEAQNWSEVHMRPPEKVRVEERGARARLEQVGEVGGS